MLRNLGWVKFWIFKNIYLFLNSKKYIPIQNIEICAI